MESYIEIIRIAAITFPFVALLMCMPIILIQYHKFGSISFFRALLIYSFTLYFMCAYFLVILPLPKISEVALLTTPRMQLIPFSFIVDFIKHTCLEITNIHTYLPALKQSFVYVPLYNIFLTIPFGIYLRYYFKCNLKKIIIYTFLLSLFFELTQLSGLYFIYPRGYRLFDVDDLILNTVGGVVGYLISKPIIKLLPSIEKVDLNAKKRGKIISGFRRTTAFGLDMLLFLILYILVQYIETRYTLLIVVLIYYFIIPIFLKGNTLSFKFLNIKVVDNKNKSNILKLYLRYIIFALIYIGIPYDIYYIISKINISNDLREYIGLIFIVIFFLMYAITAIKYLFTNKEMLYEKISKTKLVSTIVVKGEEHE